MLTGDGVHSWHGGDAELVVGECVEVMSMLLPETFDAVVTDPPYGLEFMGQQWDRFDPRAFQAWCGEWAAEAFRLLKPGGHLLAFGGSRTWHRLTCAVEDAGFEVRDSIAWLYASGFPKSLDVGKAIDKQAGAEREVVGRRTDRAATPKRDMRGARYLGATENVDLSAVTAPATDDAKRWDGWGTALKPGYEPVVVARKPVDGTVTANVLAHGTGALNVDACRSPMVDDADRAESEGKNRHADFGSGVRENEVYNRELRSRAEQGNWDGGRGRWPTNVVLTHADGCEPQGVDRARTRTHYPSARPAGGIGNDGHAGQDGLAGASPGVESVTAWRCVPGCPVGALGREARFFPTFRFEAKAPTHERPRADGLFHPTVKPLDLVRWLVRLVTPPRGVVLDPFAGSGTALEACVAEGFRCLAIEREPAYVPLIEARMARPVETVLW